MMRHLVALAILPLLVLGATPDTAPSYRPPTGHVLWSPGPGGGPAVLVPVEFARDAVTVAECESRVDTEGREAWAAVGDQGRAHGTLQVRLDVHAPAMRRLGLDPWLESDRIKYAVRLWEQSGWGPWACKP